MGQHCCHPTNDSTGQNNSEIQIHIGSYLISPSKSLEKLPVSFEKPITIERELRQFKRIQATTFQRWPNDSPKPHNTSSKNSTMDDYKNMLYFWIDERVYQNQNSRNLRIFLQRGMKVTDVSCISTLKYELKSTTKKDLVVVISSASLAESVYEFMQADERIHEIILFCMSEQRARMLMREENKFTKIKAAGYNVEQLLRKVRQRQIQYVKADLISSKSVIQLPEPDDQRTTMRREIY